MPFQVLSQEQYHQELITYHTSAELLDIAVQKGADIQRIFQILRLEENSDHSVTYCQYEWQLLILGGVQFDLESQSIDIYTQHDNLGKTLAHYLALSGNLVTLTSLLTHQPNCLQSKDKMGHSIAHFAMCSDNLDLLDWIKTNHYERLETINIDGRNIAHFAALAGNYKTLDWLRSNGFTHLLHTGDRFNNTIAHLAMIKRHENVLNWIKDNCPSLLSKKDNNGHTIAHTAMLLNHFDILDWIKKNKPSLLKEKNNKGYTILHITIESDDIERFKWIQRNAQELINEEEKSEPLAHTIMKLGGTKLLSELELYYPQRLKKKDKEGLNIAFLSAKLSKIEVLTWIHTNLPSLVWENLSNGYSLPFYAAQSKNFLVLNWIKEHCPQLLSEKHVDNSTLAHAVAILGDIQMLAWLKDNAYDLLSEKTLTNNNIVHYAANYAQANVINYMIQECPVLLKTLWYPNLEQKTPHDVAPDAMPIKPNQLRDNALLDATNRYVVQTPKPNDEILLSVFQEEWFNLLLRTTDAGFDILINSIQKFPQVLQNIIITLKPFLKLRQFSFGEQPINRDNLQELVTLALNSLPTHGITFFRNNEPKFHQQLQLFLRQLNSNSLTENQIWCLQRIVEDYKQNIFEKNTSTHDLMIHKLLQSVTFQSTNTKNDSDTIMTINIETFPDYFKQFANLVSKLSLDKETTENMNRLVLPGIEHLIHNKEKIIHSLTTDGQSYYILADGLLLVADENNTDSETFRQTLNNLLINLFGAINVANNKGRLKELCEKLSTGQCFAGRTRDAFTWAAFISDIESIHALMSRYVTQEYLPYANIMMHCSEEEVFSISNASRFIMQRHNNTPCIIDPTFAPEGKINHDVVNKYLADILGYSDNPTTCRTL